MSYTAEDLPLFVPLLDPEKRNGTSYFELHPKELPSKHACWLTGSLFIQDAAFDFFAECFHTASKDFDYFAFQRFGESEISALSIELKAFQSVLLHAPSREALFSRYASLFTEEIWSGVETALLAGAVISCGNRLLDFINEHTKESKCLWVLGMSRPTCQSRRQTTACNVCALLPRPCRRCLRLISNVGRHRETVMYRNAALFPLFLLLANLSQAQELHVGTVLVVLGVERAAVYKSLQTRYKLVQAGGDSMYMVMEGKSPNMNTIGSITFKDDRVVAASRVWASFEGRSNPVEVAKALAGALESAQAATTATAKIETKTFKTPGVVYTTIDFLFPNRKVTVLSADGDAKHGQQVSVSEIILTNRP